LTIQRLGASEHIGLTIMTGLCQVDSRHRCDCVYSMEVCSSIASPAQSKPSKEGMLSAQSIDTVVHDAGQNQHHRWRDQGWRSTSLILRQNKQKSSKNGTM
jgi:hypothetical protein